MRDIGTARIEMAIRNYYCFKNEVKLFFDTPSDIDTETLDFDTVLNSSKCVSLTKRNSHGGGRPSPKAAASTMLVRRGLYVGSTHHKCSVLQSLLSRESGAGAGS